VYGRGDGFRDGHLHHVEVGGEVFADLAQGDFVAGCSALEVHAQVGRGLLQFLQLHSVLVPLLLEVVDVVVDALEHAVRVVDQVPGQDGVRGQGARGHR
jgi:hypothetical protein